MFDKEKNDLFSFSPYGPKPLGTRPLDRNYSSFDDEDKDDENDFLNEKEN